MIDQGLVCAVDASIAVEHHDHFDVYRPHLAAGEGPFPAVIFITGLPDPGAKAYFGKPMKEWRSYTDWGRVVAAAGFVGVTYENVDPIADALAIVRRIREHANELRIDPARIGICAFSGHVPNALHVIAETRPAFAALWYGYTLDQGDSTIVANAAKQFYFSTPPVELDALRSTPMLIVRAGRDTTPGLDDNLHAFIAAMPHATVIEHAEGPHAFDMMDPSDRSRDVIAEAVRWYALAR